MGVRRGRGFVASDQLAKLLSQILNPAVDLGEMIEELEDHLNARQVDAQVALEAQDRPDPPDLGGFVALIARPTGLAS